MKKGFGFGNGRFGFGRSGGNRSWFGGNSYGNKGFGGNFFQLRPGDIVSTFVYLNVGVFLFVTLVNLFLMLFGVPANPWVKYLQLPAWLPTFFFQPWSLITYMFLHVHVFHLLFNMLWLLWFGRLFLNFFSSKHFRGLYILGGIYGGLSFVLAYNILPGFEDSLPNASLLGASASVLAIVVATAVREPDLPVQFMFLGSVRLKFLAMFIIAFDLLFLSFANAGGHIAHLGGAAAGWFFASGLNRGIDRTHWINSIIDLCTTKLNPSSWFKARIRKPKMKVNFGKRQQDYEYNAQRKQSDEAQKKEADEEINHILDKLRKSGYGSLTTEEKRRLFDSSKK